METSELIQELRRIQRTIDKEVSDDGSKRDDALIEASGEIDHAIQALGAHAMRSS